MINVAIQGAKASFHDTAARQFFGQGINILPCETFKDTFESLRSEKVDFALVAIENSLFGSINEVYDLLIKNDFWIDGEIYLKIKQCLIAIPGANIADIKEVHSHPVALAQCQDYLDKFLPHAERREHYDTAASVSDIMKWADKSKAAIAGTAAAELHGMNVLAESIETNHDNYTRFVVLGRSKESANNTNKTSLVLTTHGDNKPGALYRALGVFAKRDINLSLLHSRPVVGKSWHYLFYLDVTEGISSKKLLDAFKELEASDCELTVLGSYISGR